MVKEEKTLVSVLNKLSIFQQFKSLPFQFISLQSLWWCGSVTSLEATEYLESDFLNNCILQFTQKSIQLYSNAY